MGYAGQATLWFADGELDELWANVMLGLAADPSRDGFEEKAVSELHRKIARYARRRDGGREVPTYPGERRLLVKLGSIGQEAEPRDADEALLALLLERPELLAIEPRVEALVDARGGKRPGRTSTEGSWA